MPTLSSVTNYFITAQEEFATNLTSTINNSTTGPITLDSLAGYTDGDILALVFDPGVSGKEELIVGEKSGSTLINCVRAVEGTAAGHSSGADVVDYTSATHQAALVKGALVHANQDGTLKDKSVTYNTLSDDLSQGWLDADETWTYSSATEITVPSDATTKYSAGMLIKLTQSTGGTKYFAITGVTSTALTIAGLDGATLANEAITDPHYSHGMSPYGAPQATVTPEKLESGTGADWAWQDWTPTLSGRFTDGDWTKDCQYIQIGKTVFFKLNLTASAATPMSGGSGEATFTLPVTAAAGMDLTNALPIATAVRMLDAGTGVKPGQIFITSTTEARIRGYDGSNNEIALDATTQFTWASGDQIVALGFYEAA